MNRPSPDLYEELCRNTVERAKRQDRYVDAFFIALAVLVATYFIGRIAIWVVAS